MAAFRLDEVTLFTLNLDTSRALEKRSKRLRKTTETYRSWEMDDIGKKSRRISKPIFFANNPPFAS